MSSRDPILLLRADAGGMVGSGHVMRCLALAQAWQDAGCAALLASVDLPRPWRERLEREGVEVLDIAAAPGSADDARLLAETAERRAARAIALDGYRFGAEYQRLVKLSGRRLLMFDEYGHADYYHADFILNQNAYADAAMYPRRGSDTRLLLGASYVVLRREFARRRGRHRPIPTRADKLLITMGGVDLENVTQKAMTALHGSADFEARVVAGQGNPHFDRLAAAAGAGIRLERAADDFPELLAWADLAISAGGTTLYELAFMGLPALVVVLADNQQLAAARLHEDGVIRALGWHTELAPDRIGAAVESLRHDVAARREMSERGRRLVDGRGAARVAAILLGRE